MSWRAKVSQSRTCIAVTIAVLSVCFASCRVRADDPTRPNILLVVVDDLGWAGVGYHAKSMVTPNLNKLAREGRELSRFYVYPVCSPTRVALLTGQMPRRFDVLSALQGAEPGMPKGLPTIPAVFKTTGYQTSLVGKWHAENRRSSNRSIDRRILETRTQLVRSGVPKNWPPPAVQRRF